ncbi:MAG: RidA family protein [Oligoflexia bacterium]|nr:RidA family protein [Oligoflexia bacterium]
MANINFISTENAPKAVGTYSQGTEHNGIYFFSGQIGLDPATMKMRDDFNTQLEQILKNIDGLLNASSLTRKDIIKTTIFLVDMGHFPIVNACYEKFFQAPYPARSCVEVTKLPKEALIEIEVIAVKQK